MADAAPLHDWPDLMEALMAPPRGETLDPPRPGPVDPVLEVLSTACRPWELAHFAGCLREAGYTVPRRAEAESAASLHWLVGHALKAGHAWRASALEELQGWKAKADAEAAAAEPAQ